MMHGQKNITSVVVRCVPFPNLLHNVFDDAFSIEQDAVK
jgi:hypothetical protein